jgi:hypothetical protein
VDDNEDNDRGKDIITLENQMVEEPKVGMMFDSEEEVLSYYKQYAKQVGFGVTKRSRKIGDDGNLRYFTIACLREGKSKSKASNIVKPKAMEKMECKAKINAKLSEDGRFKLSKVLLEHNHVVSPSKAKYFRCHKKLNAHVKRKLEQLDDAGVRMSKSYKALAIEAGGYENLSFGEKDCRNYINKVRNELLGEGDAEALRNYLMRMQQKNDRFFYVIDLDEESRLKNVFWADARSRAAYESFGDVITFDTTYLTNKYKMPFAPFVGVNHHGQSILFGCGLLSNENTDTFVWLFETWLKCMSDRAPNAIITDQDRAMQAAIRRVFPRAKHRFCLWHIMSKVPHKLGSYSQYENFKGALLNCVYDSLTCDEFETRWQQVVERYNLEENAWLCQLYGERHQWVPAYVKGTFWAGMSTTQRSESMNAFFDGYVGPSTTLKKFVGDYDNALMRMVENERLADFGSFNKMFPLITLHSIEHQLQAIYTNEKFKEVQEEFRGFMMCFTSLLKCEGAISTYEVIDRIRVNGDFTKEVKYCVYFNGNECEVKCTCRLFEFRGIMCRHALIVLTLVKDVKELPSKYILDRWRKDLKRKYTFVKSSYDDLSGNPKAQKYDDLCNDFSEVAFLASDHNETYMTVKACVRKLKEELLCNDLRSESSLSSAPSLHIPGAYSICNEAADGRYQKCNKLRSPLVAKSKGKPSSTRKQSIVEKVVRKLKLTKVQQKK